MTLYNCRLKDDDCKTKFVFSAIKLSPNSKLCCLVFFRVIKPVYLGLQTCGFAANERVPSRGVLPSEEVSAGWEPQSVFFIPYCKVVCLAQCGLQTWRDEKKSSTLHLFLLWDVGKPQTHFFHVRIYTRLSYFFRTLFSVSQQNWVAFNLR